MSEINSLTPKISLVIPLTVCHTVRVMLKFGEFGIGSTNNLLTDIFLYSHLLSTWYCSDIVRRNSVLVIHRS